MPKIIKKRPAKKHPIQENEVKSAALQALDKLRQRQRQTFIVVSIIAAVIILYIVFALYSSSTSEKAYSLEMQAYNVYYSAVPESVPDAERWKKALELYKESVEIQATPTALFALGNCYYNLQDYDNAIKEYNRFVSEFRGAKEILPLVYEKLAAAYFRTGQDEMALATLEKLGVVANGIFRDTALILEARYYDRVGEKETALEKYREIITKFPASPWSSEAGSKVAATEAEKPAPSGDASVDEEQGKVEPPEGQPVEKDGRQENKPQETAKP